MWVWVHWCACARVCVRMCPKDEGQRFRCGYCTLQAAVLTRPQQAAPPPAPPRGPPPPHTDPQVFHVCTSPVVQGAWAEGQELYVWGVIYDVADGLMRRLAGPLDAKSDIGALRWALLFAGKRRAVVRPAGRPRVRAAVGAGVRGGDAGQRAHLILGPAAPAAFSSTRARSDAPPALAPRRRFNQEPVDMFAADADKGKKRARVEEESEEAAAAKA